MQVNMLDAAGVRSHALLLRALLLDAVAHGASVGFVMPLAETVADAYWRDVAEAVEAGSRILLVGWREHRAPRTAPRYRCRWPHLDLRVIRCPV